MKPLLDFCQIRIGGTLGSKPGKFAFEDQARFDQLARTRAAATRDSPQQWTRQKVRALAYERSRTDAAVHQAHNLERFQGLPERWTGYAQLLAEFPLR